MSTNLDELVPEIREAAKELVLLASQAGLNPQVTSTRRTHGQQVRLYMRWLAGRSRYPTAVPGTSAHEYGEAFDCIVTPYSDIDLLGEQWQDWGGTWGGRADPIHFEAPGASQSHKIGPRTHTIAEVVDFIIGFNPTIGAVELAATLLHLGFPRSEVLDFLSGPLGYLTR